MMSNTKKLSFQRLTRLIANDFRAHKKVLTIAAATLIILFVLIPLPLAQGFGAYFFILYLAGFVITASAFNEIHDARKGYLFLMLPCSNLERFLSKWFVTSLGFALFTLIIYYVFSLLNFFVHGLVYGEYNGPLNPFNANLWLGIMEYIVLQSVVLLGAIIFKKHALIKTALCVACLWLVVSTVSAAFTWIICPDCFVTHFSFMTLMHKGSMIFWIVLAPFCWYITYLRLTECELK